MTTTTKENQRNVEMGKLKRGELVWARVAFPHKWWPGLLLRTDSLGCFVSFFHLQSPRYFHPSQICSFQQHFKLHITAASTTSPTANTLLDRAFKFLGQKLAFDLKCPPPNPNPSGLFRPQEVLGFVRSVAVSPWVEDADFLTAVNVLAQITAFRHHLLNSSGCLRMEADPPCSSDMMHTVTEDLDTSGMEENCRVGMENQVLSEQLEKNFSASLIDKKKMNNLFPDECFSPSAEDQLDIISTIQTNPCKSQSHREALVKQEVPTLNQFYLDGNCSNTLNCSVLSPRNSLYQTTFDICFKNCRPCERREPQSLNIGYIEFPCITRTEYPVKCLGLKRRLDQSVVAEPTLKLRKTLLFSINGAVHSGPSELCNTMALSSNGAYASIAHLLFGSPAKLKTPNLSYVAERSSTHICSGSLMDLVGNMLKFSLLEHGSSKVLKLDEIDYSLDNSGMYISCANKQQLEQREAICTTDAHDDAEKMMLQLSDSQLVGNYETGTCTDGDKADDVGSGTRNEHELLPDNSISIEISGGRSINVENREPVQPVTSDSASKSQASQQLDAQTTLAFSKSVFIKFPVNYSLPSKEELVKRFSPFGVVDSFSTKVYFYTGTARVVFLRQLDATAAYQFAKRNKIFGEKNIRFWLDPTEHKRGTKFPVRFSSLTAEVPEFNPKSCLKKSNKSLMKEDKGCPRKVRFVVET